MKAALITAPGANPTVEERDLPAPADGEVTVELEAASLNPVDLAIASGGFYAGHPPMPYVPAIEAVGRLEDGRRVFVMGGGLGVVRDGTAAERFNAPEIALVDMVSWLRKCTATVGRSRSVGSKPSRRAGSISSHLQIFLKFSRSGS